VTNQKPSPGSLSPGATAGIVVGGVFVLFILAIIILCLIFLQTRAKKRPVVDQVQSYRKDHVSEKAVASDDNTLEAPYNSSATTATRPVQPDRHRIWGDEPSTTAATESFAIQSDREPVNEHSLHSHVPIQGQSVSSLIHSISEISVEDGHEASIIQTRPDEPPGLVADASDQVSLDDQIHEMEAAKSRLQERRVRLLELQDIDEEELEHGPGSSLPTAANEDVAEELGGFPDI